MDVSGYSVERSEHAKRIAFTAWVRSEVDNIYESKIIYHMSITKPINITQQQFNHLEDIFTTHLLKHIDTPEQTKTLRLYNNILDQLINK